MVSNQIKSDFLLLKLHVDNQTGEEVKFQPSIHRIMEIVKAMGGFFQP